MWWLINIGTTQSSISISMALASEYYWLWDLSTILNVTFFFILMPTIAHGDYYCDIIIIMYGTRWQFRRAMFEKCGFSIILIIILYSLTTLIPPVPYRLTATRPARLFYLSDATSWINIIIFTFAEIKRNNFLSTRSIKSRFPQLFTIVLNYYILRTLRLDVKWWRTRVRISIVFI